MNGDNELLMKKYFESLLEVGITSKDIYTSDDGNVGFDISKESAQRLIQIFRDKGMDDSADHLKDTMENQDWR